MTSSVRFPVPVRSAVKSNLTDWCFQILSKRALNALTVQALYIDKVIIYSYVSDIETIEACIRFLSVMMMWCHWCDVGPGRLARTAWCGVRVTYLFNRFMTAIPTGGHALSYNINISTFYCCYIRSDVVYRRLRLSAYTKKSTRDRNTQRTLLIVISILQPVTAVTGSRWLLIDHW